MIPIKDNYSYTLLKNQPGVTSCFLLDIYLPNPSMSRMQYKVSFKQSTTGLNQKFSFSSTGCFAKTKELSLLYYLTLVGREKNIWIHYLFQRH